MIGQWFKCMCNEDRCGAYGFVVRIHESGIGAHTLLIERDGVVGINYLPAQLIGVFENGEWRRPC